MTSSSIWLLAALPLLALCGWAGARWPVRGPLAAYAGVVPFASGVSLPLPAPAPFDTLSTTVGAVATGCLLLFLVLHPARVYPLRAPLPLSVLYVAVALASSMWSIDTSRSASSLSVLCSVVLLFVLASAVRPNRTDMMWLKFAVVAGGVGTSLYGLSLLLTGGLTSTDGSVPRFATAGGGGGAPDPNITAASLLLPAVVSLTWLLRAHGIRKRALALSCVASIVTGIFLTGSRGGLLALAVIIIIVLAHEKGTGPTVAGVVIVAVLSIGVIGVLPAGLAERLQTGSSTGRTQIWQAGAATCERYCLTGSGWDTFPAAYEHVLLASPALAGHDGARAYEAHNIWLSIVVETGVVGLLIALTLVVVVVRAVRGLPRELRGPPMASLVGVLTANMFLSNFSFKYFWLVLMFAALETARHEVPGNVSASNRSRPAQIGLVTA